jgi:hypothetical protein
MERPRALPHPTGPLGQEHPLVAAQGPRAPDRRQLATLAEVQHANQPLPRLPAARGAAAALPPPRPALAPAHLDAWLAWASDPRLRPFVRLARTLRAHRDGILAAIRLGLSKAASRASTARSASSATAASVSTRPPIDRSTGQPRVGGARGLRPAISRAAKCTTSGHATPLCPELAVYLGRRICTGSELDIGRFTSVGSLLTQAPRLDQGGTS